ncbi:MULTISPECIES: EAL domain-containing protein [unclassified Bradyrhizobium]|uniref:putative bifunctional diguanylate cyclase/phosphodiesterase n=1 Tax=unclassified Bradyrhizobium TaxID=2631580 RepID=UPI000AD228F0|nr:MULTISPECIES: EAL domain-containing protein [unclassified Bradyrhizobium]
MQRQMEGRLPRQSGNRRRLAQLLSALRYDLSWRFARPGAFRQRFEQAIANLPQGICLYDSDDRLQLVNEQFCRIYNQPMHRLRTGMRLYDVLADSCALGNYPGRSVDEIYSARKEFIDRREKGIFLQELGDGRQIAIHHQPLQDGGWVCTYEDITERRKAEAKVEFLAHHDSLTELPNRRLFTERLDHAIAHSSASKPCALLCLDLDGFKDVNDRLGHAAGDILLKNVAMRLKDRIQTGDTCARLGGDEFAVVLPGSSAGRAVNVAYELARLLRQPYFLGAFGTADVAVSIGIAILPDHAQSPEELMLRADQALYRSKNARLGLPVVFEKKWAVSPADVGPKRSSEGGGTRYGHSSLASDLAVTLQRGRELYLNYQPIYDARNGHPVAVEALARWNSPDRGHVSPLEFVKAAEENGLIDKLLEWALEAACREATSWDSELKLSINLSPLNLDSPLLIEMIERVLADTGFPAQRLIVELTEETALEHSPDRLERLRNLSILGVEIWLDDFGSGFANFEYLQYLRCDVLKIDRSFLGGYEKREPLLRGMIGLAHACGLKVVVEGVETEEHHNLLCGLGCDLLQGYWLVKPLGAGELHAALRPILPPYHESRSIIPDANDDRTRAPLPKRRVDNRP